jgi:hypothetical protein
MMASSRLLEGSILLVRGYKSRISVCWEASQWKGAVFWILDGFMVLEGMK